MDGQSVEWSWSKTGVEMEQEDVSGKRTKTITNNAQEHRQRNAECDLKGRPMTATQKYQRYGDKTTLSAEEPRHQARALRFRGL